MNAVDLAWLAVLVALGGVVLNCLLGGGSECGDVQINSRTRA